MQRHSLFRSYLPIVTGAALAVLGAVLLWANSSTTDPAAALARARSELAAGKLEEAESLVTLAAETPSTKPWAVLTLAQIAERSGNIDRATSLYQSVASQSAASLDARLALLRIEGTLGKIDIGPELAALEEDFRSHDRQDLLLELQFLRAALAEKNGDYTGAVRFFQKIRTELPGKEIAERARSSQRRIQSLTPPVVSALSVADLLAESNLLLAEAEPLEALVQAERARDLTTENSKARLETMLVQEKVLRKLNRQEEADYIMQLVSAHGELGTADVAMLAIARSSWNSNDNHHALEILDNLRKRFPTSPLNEEAHYMSARILEELNMLVEAKEAYLSLSKTSANPARAATALRRLSWIYLRNENPVYAIRFFDKARRYAAEKLVETLDQPAETFETKPAEPGISGRKIKQKLLADLEFERNHATFWQAHELKLLERDLLQQTEAANNEPVSLLSELKALDPHGFYGMLALGELGEAETQNTQLGSAECGLPLPDELTSSLTLFIGAGLNDLSRHEIDFYLGGKRQNNEQPVSLHDLAGREALDLESFELLIAKARSYLTYGNPKLGIRLFQSLLRISRFGELPGDRAAQCLAALKYQSHPLLHSAEFAQAAKEHQVPEALLFAVARTESAFDANAVSRAGAVGLLQLMPTTAKEEGLEVSQSLADPAVNIRLGAKHLSKLLGEFGQNKIAALAAYNAGRPAVNRWKSRFTDLEPLAWAELISYPETNEYVKKVLLAESVYAKLFAAKKAQKAIY